MKLMKKITMILMALAATFTMFSCDDPDNVETPKDPEGDNSGGEIVDDGSIVLNRCVGGIYFGDFWDEGYADYYFLLTNDTQIGQTEQGFDVPTTPGCWLLSIDIWGAISADHTNPIVPEGTYTLGDKRGMNVLTSEFTIATQNEEKVGDLYRITDHIFSAGTVVVTHTDKGCKVVANLTTTQGEEMKFSFEGEIVLEDKSNDEEYNPELDGNVTIEPTYARTYLYSSYENCDRHVLMLFTSDNLTYDNLHVNEPGMKLQLSLFTEPGAGLAGNYVEGTLGDGDILVKEPGVFYPGRMYGASTALGSFLERVNEDLSVEYAVLKEGTLSITANADGTHTIVGEFLSGNEGTISCEWTGVIVPHL